jgi:hypothetical protein
MTWFRRRWKEPRQRPIGLVAMRLADMLLVHPEQDNSHVCSKCGETVGVYPSGQAILARHPGTVITCQICAGQLGPSTLLAPGALEERLQSHRKEET